MLENQTKPKKQLFSEYYLVELGIAVLFIIASVFFFGEQIDILVFATIIISFFVILPLAIYILIKIANIIANKYKIYEK